MDDSKKQEKKTHDEGLNCLTEAVEGSPGNLEVVATMPRAAQATTTAVQELGTAMAQSAKDAGARNMHDTGSFGLYLTMNSLQINDVLKWGHGWVVKKTEEPGGMSTFTQLPEAEAQSLREQEAAIMKAWEEEGGRLRLGLAGGSLDESITLLYSELLEGRFGSEVGGAEEEEEDAAWRSAPVSDEQKKDVSNLDDIFACIELRGPGVQRGNNGDGDKAL